MISGLTPHGGLRYGIATTLFIGQIGGLFGYFGGFGYRNIEGDFILHDSFQWDGSVLFSIALMVMTWAILIFTFARSKEEFSFKAGGAFLASLPLMVFLMFVTGAVGLSINR